MICKLTFCYKLNILYFVIIIFKNNLMHFTLQLDIVLIIKLFVLVYKIFPFEKETYNLTF